MSARLLVGIAHVQAVQRVQIEDMTIVIMGLRNARLRSIGIMIIIITILEREEGAEAITGVGHTILQGGTAGITTVVRVVVLREMDINPKALMFFYVRALKFKKNC